MKKYIIVLGILGAFSCRQSKDISIEPFAIEIETARANAEFMQKKTKAYHAFPPFVQFYLPKTENAKTASLLQEQYNFIFKSGLPTHWNIKEWIAADNLSRARQLYEGYLINNSNHKYLNVFKQYEAWILLTRLDLLEKSDKESLEFVKILTSDLLETKYIGFGLLYYALDHLKTNSLISIELLDSYKIKVNTIQLNQVNRTTSSNAATEFEQSRNKPLPPKMKERMQQYEANLTSHQFKYLKLINEL